MKIFQLYAYSAEVRFKSVIYDLHFPESNKFVKLGTFRLNMLRKRNFCLIVN